MARNVSPNKMSFAEKLQTLEELWDELCQKCESSPCLKDAACTKKDQQANDNKKRRNWRDAANPNPDRQDDVSNR